MMVQRIDSRVRTLALESQFHPLCTYLDICPGTFSFSLSIRQEKEQYLFQSTAVRSKRAKSSSKFFNCAYFLAQPILKFGVLNTH